MTKSFCLPILLLSASLPTLAQTSIGYLTEGHTDLGIFYSPTGANRLYMQANDDDHGVSYPPNRAVLVVSPDARFDLPPGTPFGNEGDPLWILPQSQYPGILYLGLSTETIAPGTFNGPLTFSLKSLDLPGRSSTNMTERFYVWQAGQFGDFDVFMTSANGITAADAITLPASAHAHYNWGFSTSGLWHVTFQASGRVTGEATNIASTNITFAFHVLPLRPFEQWQATNWPPATPRSIIGPAADPDGDGIPNLVEYALGLNPTNASRAGLPTASIVESGGQRYGALTYTRGKSATDVFFETQAADFLSVAVWQSLTAIHSVVDFGETEQVTIRDDLPVNTSARRFYRLQVSLQ